MALELVQGNGSVVGPEGLTCFSGSVPPSPSPLAQDPGVIPTASLP